jgi:hypothetical protein
MDRPIIFSAPMVLAILAGKKSQTRRIIKPQPADGGTVKMRFLHGDRLWVRETWWPCDERIIAERLRGGIDYEADGGWHDEMRRCWRSPIHMPRWASRLTLEVTGVKVERLQDIGGEDAIAEGIDLEKHKCGCEVCSRTLQLCPATSSSLIMEFAELWDSIHGHGAWDANPWVYALSFTCPVLTS